LKYNLRGRMAYSLKSTSTHSLTPLQTAGAFFVILR